MKENSIRRAVREGRAALGTALREFASRGVPWIIEAAGFDYCAIDHEHGAFDMETIAILASWFPATNVTAIVSALSRRPFHARAPRHSTDVGICPASCARLSDRSRRRDAGFSVSAPRCVACLAVCFRLRFGSSDRSWHPALILATAACDRC